MTNEKIKEFKNSDFWQKVLRDATFRASKTENWKEFDDKSKYYVSGAKESTRSVLVEWALNDLATEFGMLTSYEPSVDYVEINEDFSVDEELRYLLELQKRIERAPKKYEAWKNGK